MQEQQRRESRRDKAAVRVAAGGCAAAILGAAQHAHALDIAWNQATGAHSFNTGTNWVGNNAPGLADTAVFSNNFNGTVTLGATTSVDRLSFQNTAGTINVNLGGNVLNIGQAGANSTARIIVGNATGQANNVTVTNGSLRMAGTSSLVWNLGQFAANNDNNVFTLTGAGTSLTNNTGDPYSVSPNLSLSSSIGTTLGSDNNRLVVSNGAVYGVGNTLLVGSSTATATNIGNAVEVTDATLLIPGGSRGVTLQYGSSLTITNSKALIPVLTSQLAVTASNSPGTVTFNSGLLQVRVGNYNTGAGNPFTPLVVGDGGAISATLEVVPSGGTFNAPNGGIVLSANGILAGMGTITANISASAPGAKADARNAVVTANLTDDREWGTLNVTGNWDNTNIEIASELFDFPTTLAGDLTPPFDPPVDLINITGTFTHGGKITVDLAGYVAPEDQDYTLKLVGWTSATGSSALTDVSFANGGALDYFFISDGSLQGNGFYVVAAVPEPAAAGLLGVLMTGLLARRRRPAID